MQIRRTAAALTSAAALSLTGVAMATPAQAAGPINTGGLVDVTIVDFADVNIEDVIVQVPVAIAANICDVDVFVLAADLADDGNANCTATSDSRANA